MTTRRYFPKALNGHSWAWVGAVALLCGIALTGGSSRFDSIAQVAARSIGVAALLACLWASSRPFDPALRMPLALLAAAVLLVAVQLVPLPPAIWSALPGRSFYLESAAAAGIAQPWRPLSLSPDRGLATLFSLVVPAAMIAVAARLSGRERALLTGPVVVLALVSAVLGLAQISGGQQSFLRWYAVTNDRSAVGFLANRNHQALLLAMALPVAVAWARQDERPDRRWVRGWAALAVSILLLLVLPTTGSRAGLVLGVIGAATAGLIAWPVIRRRIETFRRRRRRMIYGAAAAGAAVFVAVWVVFGRNESMRRLMDLDSAEDVRAHTFPIVRQMAGEFFPAGIGFGAFDPSYRRFEPFGMLSTDYLNQAHNDWLQLVVEGGLVAALLALILVAWWGWASLRVWRTPPSARVQAGRAGSAMIGMTILASAVDYPLRTPLMMAVFVLAACWLAAAVGVDAEAEPPH